MAQPDEAHVWTDEELSKLERRIRAEYKKALKELQGTIDDYFAKLKKRDEEMKALLDAGEITENHYKQWRLAQIGRGERFEALRDKIAERMTRANETAVAYVNDATPGIYSLNRNYAAYTIEQVAGNAGFTLWDEKTVKRLIKDEPDLMPYYPAKRALNRGIDLAYGKRQISACVTSSILQGKSIKGMADDLHTRIPTMNRTSAIRTARTAVTGAQNAGRMDSYVAAEKMGIKLKKSWLATLDGRTRHEHALLDGQTVDTDKPFKVDGYKLMFPGDPSGPAHLTYNCRCTLIAAVDGVDTSDTKRRARDPETGESVLIENMTYAEWAGWKKNPQGTAIEEIPDGVRKVYGKVDGQKYKVAVGDTVQLKASGREKNSDGSWSDMKEYDLGSFEVPKNDDPNMLVITGLPDKTKFLQFDETPNYILQDGRMALNSRAKNNNSREQIRGAVENEVYTLAGVRKDGHFYRVIGSDKEIEYIKNGTVRKSVNHMTGEKEDGLSAWEIPKYAGGKLIEITGDVVGIGSDGEPLLDVSTVKFVKIVENPNELRKKGIDAFKRKYNWTSTQFDQAMRGGYKLNR